MAEEKKPQPKEEKQTSKTEEKTNKKPQDKKEIKILSEVKVDTSASEKKRKQNKL